MNRRNFNKILVASGAGLLLSGTKVFAKTYLSEQQAMQIIWPNIQMHPFSTTLSKEQMKFIKKSSKTRVRSNIVRGFRSSDNSWLIIDNVIGKHEHIDIAVGLDNKGLVKGVEILTFRESYGDEIINPKWTAQFHGLGNDEVLKLDKHIKNISGATLSCRHVTDGVNRLTNTWDYVLRHI